MVLAFKAYAQFKDLLTEDSKIYIEGTLKVDKERDQLPTIFLNYAMPLADLREKKIRAINVRLMNDENFESNIKKLKAIVQSYPGNKMMYIHISYPDTGEQEKIIKVGHGINGAREMVQHIRKIVGQTHVWLS